MACLIDQVAVFDETGKASVTCPSSFPEQPSDFSISIDGQNLNYVGIWDVMDFPMYATGGTADNPIFPAVMFGSDLDGCFFIAAESESTKIIGEHRVSMCDSESDDSCPDVPLSESIPEKYADYIDENGNFVPKASSGGGDCAFDIINVNIIDETENVYAGDAVKIAHLISAPLSGIVSEISGGDEELQAISYNGKALLVNTGVANVTVDPISNAQPAGTPGYLYITGDVSITIKDSGGIA